MKGPGDADDAILNCLSEQVDGMVSSFIVIATYVDTDGETRIWSDSMTDQRLHQTMGLLSWGLAIENGRAVDAWREDST